MEYILETAVGAGLAVIAYLWRQVYLRARENATLAAAVKQHAKDIEDLEDATEKREEALPLTMVTGLIADFKAHRRIAHDHTEDLVRVNGDIETLKSDRDTQRRRADHFIQENTDGHEKILDKLSDLDRGLAGVQGYTAGKANGVVKP